MKKYAVYEHVEGNKRSPWLLREFDTLKDANREAYRLARCNFRNEEFSCEFIVGNNTGMTLNLSLFNEYIRYSIEHGAVFNDMFSWLRVYCWNKTRKFLINVDRMNNILYY